MTPNSALPGDGAGASAPTAAMEAGRTVSVQIPVPRFTRRLAFLLGLAGGALLGALIFAMTVGGWTKGPGTGAAPASKAAVALPPEFPPIPATEPDLLAATDRLQRFHRTDSALAMYEVFLFRHPENSTVRMRYASTLALDKKFPEAIKQYQLILKDDPENLAAQIACAKVTSWNSQLPEALQRYNAILVRHPGNYDARVGKAFTLMWMKRNDEARPLFEQAAREAPEDADVAAALRTLSQTPAR